MCREAGATGMVCGAGEKLNDDPAAYNRFLRGVDAEGVVRGLAAAG